MAKLKWKVQESKIVAQQQKLLHNDIAGPWCIVDDEETIRAEGICCREHAEQMIAGVAAGIAKRNT